MKLLIIWLILLSHFSAKAEVSCFPPIGREDFETLVKEVKESHFPELKNIQIGVSTFTSDAYFLQAQPVIKTLPKKRHNRHYSVQLNTKLLDCPPSPEALEAILVHEFEHILDYTVWSSLKIIGHGMRYALSCGVKASYERATDRKVLTKGLHEGLIEYRKWVYQWLTPKEMIKKKAIYLTPEEILADRY